jgi:hypothetical protein
MLWLRSNQLRKSLYEADESVKGSLPEKNTDDDICHELDYTRKQLDGAASRQSLAEVPKVKERLNMLKEVLADIEDHYTTSVDEDARVGHKSEDSSFFGYKTHLAMSDERIITAATVTSEEKADGLELPALVEQSRRNGMDVDTVVGNAAYSGMGNIIMAENEPDGFSLVARMNPAVSNGFRKDDGGFVFNKDAGMFVCPAGHMATRKAVQGEKKRGMQPIDSLLLRHQQMQDVRQAGKML